MKHMHHEMLQPFSPHYPQFPTTILQIHMQLSHGRKVYNVLYITVTFRVDFVSI